MEQRRVLIVDGKKDVSMALAALLEHHRYHVFLQTNGLAALDIARAECPDALLLDVELPGPGPAVCSPPAAASFFVGSIKPATNKKPLQAKRVEEAVVRWLNETSHKTTHEMDKYHLRWLDTSRVRNGPDGAEGA